jgi:hypothetical protein
MQLTTVLETRDSFAVKLAEATLEDAGIEYVACEEDYGFLPGIFGTSGIGETPLWKCSCRIQVPVEHEETARALLENLQSEEPLADEGS